MTSINADLGLEFTWHKTMWTTLNILFKDSLYPIFEFSNLYNSSPFFFGFKWDCNPQAAKLTDALELLLGYYQKDKITTYIRHYSENFSNMGRLGFGVKLQKTFTDKYPILKRNGEEEKKKIRMPLEFAAEGSFALKTDKEFEGKIGVKAEIEKAYSFQLMIDHELKLSTSYQYTPRAGFKFIWSDQTNLKNLFCCPDKGLDYIYGFTMELSPGSFIAKKKEAGKEENK